MRLKRIKYIPFRIWVNSSQLECEMIDSPSVASALVVKQSLSNQIRI